MELDTRKLNTGNVVRGLVLLAGLIYGIKTKQKFWFYLLLFLVIGPIVFATAYSAAPKTK